jgi:hypothetical protein
MEKKQDDALMFRPESGLLRVGQRTVGTKAYRHAHAFEHLKDHLGRRKKWCEVECQARVFGGRLTHASIRRVRLRLSALFSYCVDQGSFLVIEYAQHGNGHHGEALRCKLLETKHVLPQESSAAYAQLHKMHRSGELKGQKYDRACALVQTLVTGAGGAANTDA